MLAGPEFRKLIREELKGNPPRGGGLTEGVM